MSKNIALEQRWEDLSIDTETAIDNVLNGLDNTELNRELLQQVLYHHLRRSQESMIALHKAIRDYNAGLLTNETIIALALST